MNSTIFQGQLLSELTVRPILRSEQSRYRAQMAQHHYLGDLPKIGETLWYVALWRAIEPNTLIERTPWR